MLEIFNVSISPQLKSVLKARNMIYTLSYFECSVWRRAANIVMATLIATFSIAVPIAYADKRLDSVPTKRVSASLQEILKKLRL